ncbi:unnamed protein product [Cladocopium goreaui]|uniref:Uncharacterized protein n=1 Tax=Cladocopium goreaui TaxID=2562237 RepID=A0A9P1CQM7_9DINO|nr:unnamed protein product [Cladocopium goreaui]
MSRTTPIVIQLKKRTAPGATPPSEDVEEADAGGEAVENEAPAEGEDRARSNSEASSESSSHSKGNARAKEPTGPVVGGFASVDSPMDLQSLGELFRKLHEEAFARRESGKLLDMEKRNRQAAQNFKEAYGLARSFLEEYGPEGGLPGATASLQGRPDSDAGGSPGLQGPAAPGNQLN